MSTIIAIECVECGVTLDNDESSHENDDGYCICAGCAEKYTTCVDCGKIVPRDSEYRNEDGNAVCEFGNRV